MTINRRDFLATTAAGVAIPALGTADVAPVDDHLLGGAVAEDDHVELALLVDAALAQLVVRLRRERLDLEARVGGLVGHPLRALER